MKYKFIAASIISGLFLALSWPARGFTPLLFIALIPLLWLENALYYQQDKKVVLKIFFLSYLCFFIWNTLTTYWIIYSTIVGAIIAIVFNSLFMTIIFTLYFAMKKFFKSQSNFFSYSLLVILWLTFEYLHLNWELAWPWLQLGNGLSTITASIQWYEITGNLGGTLWILIINIMGFLTLRTIMDKKPFRETKRTALLLMASFCIPLIISWIRYFQYSEEKNPINVLVVQPNVDPYNEKFRDDLIETLWIRLLEPTMKFKSQHNDYIIWPETSIPGSILVNHINTSYQIRRILDTLRKHFPSSFLISGADLYEIYDYKKTSTSRYFSDGSCCWDSYNSAIEIDTSGVLNMYHKIKLVPGVERMPYTHIFGFLEKYAINLGGTSGSLGKSEKPLIFSGGKAKVAPIICYESVFGEFLSSFVLRGADFIAIITNDAWWNDTPGYRQHFQYARIRAIETRRSIARAANTGISGFINQKGQIIQKTNFWEQNAILTTINANNSITFYSRYGDYLGRIALICSIFFILSALAKFFIRKKIQK